MFDPSPEPVPDAELEAVLAAALRSSGGQITRPTECFMADDGRSAPGGPIGPGGTARCTVP